MKKFEIRSIEFPGKHQRARFRVQSVCTFGAVVSLSAVVGLMLPMMAWAETYISGFAGGTIPRDLTNIEGVHPPSTARNVPVEDLALASSFVSGAKFGHYLSGKLSWLGAETEFFYANPHVKQQRYQTAVTTRGLGGGYNVQSAPGSHMRVATQAVNVVVRYPGERFQPYVGMGLGTFWGRVSGTITDTGSDTALGLNFLAGLRYFVTPEIAVFGEYKHSATTFDLGGTAMLRVDYTSNNFVFGLGYHF